MQTRFETRPCNAMCCGCARTSKHASRRLGKSALPILSGVRSNVVALLHRVTPSAAAALLVVMLQCRLPLLQCHPGTPVVLPFCTCKCQAVRVEPPSRMFSRMTSVPKQHPPSRSCEHTQVSLFKVKTASASRSRRMMAGCRNMHVSRPGSVCCHSCSCGRSPEHVWQPVLQGQPYERPSAWLPSVWGVRLPCQPNNTHPHVHEHDQP